MESAEHHRPLREPATEERHPTRSRAFIAVAAVTVLVIVVGGGVLLYYSMVSPVRTSLEDSLTVGDRIEGYFPAEASQTQGVYLDYELEIQSEGQYEIEVEPEAPGAFNPSLSLLRDGRELVITDEGDGGQPSTVTVNLVPGIYTVRVHGNQLADRDQPANFALTIGPAK